jgi:hypothetical protein
MALPLTAIRHSCRSFDTRENIRSPQVCLNRDVSRMIFNPAGPVKRSTSGFNSSPISTSRDDNRTATLFLPSAFTFFVDFFALLW